MKKIVLSLTILCSLTLVSCAEESSEENEVEEVKDPICECAEAEQEMIGLLEKAENIEAENKIRKSFNSKKHACNEIYIEFREEIKDLTDDQKKAKLKAMEESCPAMKR